MEKLLAPIILVRRRAERTRLFTFRLAGRSEQTQLADEPSARGSEFSEERVVVDFSGELIRLAARRRVYVDCSSSTCGTTAPRKAELKQLSKTFELSKVEADSLQLGTNHMQGCRAERLRFFSWCINRLLRMTFNFTST